MNFEKYKNNHIHPKRPSRSCNNCNSIFSLNDIFCSSCGFNVKDFYKKELAKYNELKKSYDGENRRVLEMFKNDALEEVGLWNHKNKDKIYDFAWEHGHSSGLYDVYYWLQEISILFDED